MLNINVLNIDYGKISGVEGSHLARRHWDHMGRLEDRFGPALIGLVSFGSFLILLGIIIAITPNIVTEVTNFLNDLRFRQFFPFVYFWVPSSAHPVLYNAVLQFCVGWGIVQAIFLLARFAVGDWPERKARSISSVVFWFGLAYVVYLLINVVTGPVAFSYFVIIAGISILVRVIGYFL